MTSTQDKPSPFVDEFGIRVDADITFPVVRFTNWIVAVWKIHNAPSAEKSLAVSFYSKQRVNFRVPRRLFYVANLLDKDHKQLKHLWWHYPGLPLVVALQLVMFHELPSVLEQSLREFTLRELELRMPPYPVW